MNYILVAEKGEAKHILIPEDLRRKTKIIIIGIGEHAVIRTLSRLILSGKIHNDDKIFNIGYCGSNTAMVGEVVEIGCCALEKPSHTIRDRRYVLGEAKVTCYSAGDFVEKTRHKGVFDMELYTIAGFFKHVFALKIVSDNLNYKQYKEVDLEKSWQIANDRLFAMMR